MSHAGALKSLKDLYALEAVCDVDRKTAERVAGIFSVSIVFSDYRQMVAEEKLDVISIATRTDVRNDILAYASLTISKEYTGENPSRGA